MKKELFPTRALPALTWGMSTAHTSTATWRKGNPATAGCPRLVRFLFHAAPVPLQCQNHPHLHLQGCWQETHPVAMLTWQGAQLPVPSLTPQLRPTTSNKMFANTKMWCL